MNNLLPIDIIPYGFYCYDKNGICPYWNLIENLPFQENGYCEYLKEGDYNSKHLSLLWDQCKECGINKRRKIETKNI